MQSLGDRIKSIRLELGETMEEFGARFNTSKGTINNWEKNRNKPNKANLKAIADLGGLTVEELLSGNPSIEKSVDDVQSERAEKFINNKEQVWKQEAKLLAPSVASGLLTLGLGFKKSRAEAIHDYEAHQKRIQALEQYSQDYIDKNYDNYTYDKYIRDFPNSNPQGFEQYKEKEWVIFKEVLENFWESFDIITENSEWINTRFTDQIADELNKISKKADEEDREHYYVNEVVQPFLDQAANDFKEYIKEFIDTED